MGEKTVLVTGSGGLAGSESVRWFAENGYSIVGIDNDMRRYFFGHEASTAHVTESLSQQLGPSYIHHNLDIRNRGAVDAVLKEIGRSLSAIIHTAAQPSHDWAATEPFTDFEINAVGTLNLLEAARLHAPECPFVFTSTNKVYGDRPNQLPFVELPTRFELPSHHEYFRGINEAMSIDDCTHSLFGASKVAADVLVQEYGRYFGMPTACFRGGCLTGEGHAGAEQHGFLSYLMKCAVSGRKYSVFGHLGKQVRDNIHSRDLIAMFGAFVETPRSGAVYNVGGSRFSNCSMAEAVSLCEEIVGRQMVTEYVDMARIGDHKWWITDVSKFQHDYPQWRQQWTVKDILQAMYDTNSARWTTAD